MTKPHSPTNFINNCNAADIKYNVIVSSDINKILPYIFSFSNKHKIKHHFINNSTFWHAESDTGDHLICVSPEKLKHINIQISNLWIDNTIPQEIADKIILNKYIGRIENIIRI